MKRLMLILLTLAMTGWAAETDRIWLAQVAQMDEAEPLTHAPGKAEIGQTIFADREVGHCVLCHQVKGLAVPFQGNLGPDLSSVGTRLTNGQIRLRIMDASLLNPRTVMPPYYRTHGLHQVLDEQVGKTVLSGQQIEHLVAYLAGLEER